MALGKSPLSGAAASASIGMNANWFHDAGSYRARQRPPGGGPRTARRAAVRDLNAEIYDRWDDLSDAQRRGWESLSRFAARRTPSGLLLLPARLVYCSRNILRVDNGLPPLDDAPAPSPVLLVRDFRALRLADGTPSISWAIANSGIPLDCFVDVACSRPRLGAPASWRSARLAHLCYARPDASPVPLPSLGAAVYTLGIRPVLADGRTWRFWLTATLPAWP